MDIDVALVKLESKDVGERMQLIHQKVFKGVGKLKDCTIQLHIDPGVKPVAQPNRRIPFSLRSKVEEKIQQHTDLDITAPVKGPTSWVNPIIIVPKS